MYDLRELMMHHMWPYALCVTHRQDGSTALIWASMEGYLEVVQALLAAGADKEVKGKVGGWLGCIYIG